MVLSFVSKLWRSSQPAEPVAVEGRRVFAIGDIHGCDDLLASLIEGLDHVCRNDSQPPILVFLGDYVDRGPGSRQVIERLVGLQAAGRPVRFLTGNHEEAMLKFLTDLEAGLAWSRYGGKATMASYGVSCPEDEGDLAGWRVSQIALKAAMPAEHMRFLWSLEDRIELGDFLFVHAGVNPDKPLDQQTQRDLRWIREPFLSDRRSLGKVVVHGHTPASQPYADHRRIGVDTWAYRSGVLTALELKDGAQRFWQAVGGDEVIVVDQWRPPAPSKAG